MITRDGPWSPLAESHTATCPFRANGFTSAQKEETFTLSTWSPSLSQATSLCGTKPSNCEFASPPLPFLLTGSLHYLLSCPGPVYTHPGIYEKQTNVSAETVCPVHWEDCGSASAKLGLYSLNDWKWGCLILFCLLFVLKWNKRWTYN